jgi:EAL domain-containing protein (putative c-di-GMP-specific phosphodiesterase class I)
MTTIQPGRPAPIKKIGKRQIKAIEDIIANEALQPVFQPIYALNTGKVFGFEVLTRLEIDLFKTIPEVFDAAVQIDRVGDLGRVQKTLSVKVAPPKPLFVNVHPAEFDFPLLVRPDDPLFRHPEDVYLEITESAPLSYFEQCTNVLGELRKKGVRVAVDDFGAGFSNVKYIADLSPDIVKLDRELVSGVREGTRQFKLLISIVRLCNDMGAKVVAEGIETSAELVVAERAGVDFCQGYLLGRPGPDAREEEWPAFR